MQNPGTKSKTNIHPCYAPIISAFPNLCFRSGRKFAYHPPKTVVIGPQEPHSELLLLHEVSHATLHHSTYQTDVERLRIESEAWEHARTLANSLNIPFLDDFAEEKLDSYRNWLHSRSLCKTCGITRYQTPDGRYHCPKCSH